MNVKTITILLLLILFSTFAVGKSNGDKLGVGRECDQHKNVEFVINDIFDLTTPDTIFLHHWANFLHIKTKPITLTNESAFFLKKCEISKADLLELERHLRQRKYIREASVKQDENQKIIVESYDNWSLMPTLDFGRKGGINKYSLGLKDRNLLGLGIDAEIEYFSNNQRTGYKLKAQVPLFLKQNITAKLKLTSNDDGSSESFYIDKEFVSFDTPYAYAFGFDNFNQVDTQFQNGSVVAQYNHDKTMSIALWQLLYRDSSSETLRYGFGYANEKHHFTPFLMSPDTLSEHGLAHALANGFKNEQTLVALGVLQTDNKVANGFLPQNRAHSYPFLSVEYLQKDYRKFTNFNLINQIEDFNLGWHAMARVGTDISNSDFSALALWRVSISKGIKRSESGYLFFDASFEGEFHKRSDTNNRYLLSFSTEYFHKFSHKWGGYLKNANTLSQHPFLDQPVALGDDSGVRGFPLQYQHGSRTTQLTVEARYYPHINIYKLFELGGAAFVDAGKAFGPSPVNNTKRSLMTSVGIGARFYSTHSSEAQVIHLDIVKPISSDVNVNNVEFRITTKHSF